MGLVDRVNASLAVSRHRSADSLSWEQYQDFFAFGSPGAPFIQTTMGALDREKVAASAIGAYKGSGPVFSLVLARMRVFSQVRFQWTHMSGAMPGDLFGTSELSVLERPWPGGVTSDLLARMEMHDSLAGNAYVRRTRTDRLNVLRPDLMTIILGSQEEPEDPALAADVEVAGYFYTPAGGRPQIFLPDEVAHFAPIPDPWFHFLGQSWITPVLRELQGDLAATEHKWKFFENSATVNLAIKFDPQLTLDKVKAFKALMEEEHRGIANAFRTLFLGGGADPVPVGSSFKDMDYAVIQGRAESRLASAAGVHPTIVGFMEGLQGSSLNQGNFQAARRLFGETTMAHLWGNAASSLQSIIRPPDPGASLWYDNRVPFMRQDEGDVADIQNKQAVTIGTLVKDGFTADSAVKAVLNNDMSLLKHTGLVSVQLLPPGEMIDPGDGQPPRPPVAAPPPAPAVPAAASSNGKNPDVSANGSAPAGGRALNGYPAAGKTDAAKSELAVFRRYSQGCRKAGEWRDFRFEHADTVTAHRLNDAGRLAVRSAAGEIAVAGLAVLAADTGRVLMLQRALDDEDPAAGMWEFPGGHLEGDEAPLAAAWREWQEETGSPCAPGVQTGTWTSGIYQGIVWTVEREAMVPVRSDAVIANPDDPDGDQAEAIAWWNPADLPGNPAVRPELLASIDDVMAALGCAPDDGGTPDDGDESVCPCGTPVIYDEMNGWQHADGSVSHDDGESVSDKMAAAKAPAAAGVSG